MIKISIILGSLMLVTGQASADSVKYWYSDQQLSSGETVFKQNCAACHGQNAEGTRDWKKTNVNGNYPPPPLDGSAHAWHHSKELLKSTILEGGIKLGGVMPGFSGKLSDAKIDSAIAYFQSKWPDQTYQKWAERFEVVALPVTEEIVETDNSAITKLLRQRTGNTELDQPEKTAIDNIWQVKLNNKTIYLSEDGRYAITGDLIDLESGENLTQNLAQKKIVEQINNYSDDDLVVYIPKGEIKATLNIFTDTSCPYCRKLHQEVPKLLESGIKVRYLPYARGGKKGPGYETMKSVWCAEDRAGAMDDAKNEDTSGLPEGSCAASQIVDAGYITGNQVGVTGTPALFKQNGEKIDGYVPYQTLIPMLLQ
jgi:thiol:disulfide interchange protein DsbC